MSPVKEGHMVALTPIWLKADFSYLVVEVESRRWQQYGTVEAELGEGRQVGPLLRAAAAVQV
eukprot:361967-Chlamydomonas_euryale.AAC.5